MAYACHIKSRCSTSLILENIDTCGRVEETRRERRVSRYGSKTLTAPFSRPLAVVPLVLNLIKGLMSR